MKWMYLFVVLVCIACFGCTSKRTEVSKIINDRASLRGDLPFDPFQGKVVATFVNPQESTMSTLYGNDIAVRHARTDPQKPYPTGSVLSFVTWYQVEDDHWFGAKIPGEIKSVEFVKVDALPNNSVKYSYDIFEGSPLERVNGDSVDARVNFLISQKALVMP